MWQCQGCGRTWWYDEEAPAAEWRGRRWCDAQNCMHDAIETLVSFLDNEVRRRVHAERQAELLGRYAAAISMGQAPTESEKAAFAEWKAELTGGKS